MRPLKCFVARSFDQVDDEKVRPVLDLLNSFLPLGMRWETAERAELESVSKKVRQKIDECDIFVGVFTRRHPIFASEKLGAMPEGNPTSWSGPPWLFQESGYALGAGKKLLLIRENGVELPNLQGDLEYIDYDPNQPQGAWKKAHQVLTGLIAENAGISTSHFISGPEPSTPDNEPTVEKAVPTLPQSPGSSLDQCFSELITAFRAADLDEIKRAELKGVEVIQTGIADLSEIEWRSLSLSFRGRSGDTEAIQLLQDLSATHPAEAAPYRAQIQIARACGEYRTAGDWSARAAGIVTEKFQFRLGAARDYRDAKEWNLARNQLQSILKDSTTSNSIRADALKEMFLLLRDSGDKVAAFCFGEAVIQLVPNDSDFRFQLAYAYSSGNGSYAKHHYQDLALVHYRMLGLSTPKIEYAQNNLGVVYNYFKLPINAIEQFKEASRSGNALATSNVIKQYIDCGFVEEANEWSESQKPALDEKGYVAQALAAVHGARDAEDKKIEAVIAKELSHRAGLANLAQLALIGSPPEISGECRFPDVSMEISRTGDLLKGTGRVVKSNGSFLHQISASYRDNLWNFERRAKKEAEYYSSDNALSYGLMAFSSDGACVYVLEYNSDGFNSWYEAERIISSVLIE